MKSQIVRALGQSSGLYNLFFTIIIVSCSSEDKEEDKEEADDDDAKDEKAPAAQDAQTPGTLKIS